MRPAKLTASLFLITTALVGSLVSSALPAFAVRPQAGAGIGDGGTPQVGVENPGEDPGSVSPGGGSSGSGTVRCRYYDQGSGEPVQLGSIPPGDYGLGISLTEVCTDTKTGETVSSRDFAYIPGSGSVVSPVVLAERARRELAVPEPEVHSSPGWEHPRIVRVPVWLWVPPESWVALSTTASAAGVSATVTATPVSVTWVMGDGGEVVCDGPGTVYNLEVPYEHQSTDCSYTYVKTSRARPDKAYTASATITYEVTWSAAGATGGGALGPITRTTRFAVKVAELQALVTSGSS